MKLKGDDRRVLKTFQLAQSGQYREMVDLVDQLLDEELDEDEANICFMFNNYLIALLKTEQYDKGARFADEIQPIAMGNPHIYHNAACLYCFTGQLDHALEQVRLAREHGGMALIRVLADDEDLIPIASHPEFVAIVRGKKTKQRDGGDAPPPDEGMGPLPY